MPGSTFLGQDNGFAEAFFSDSAVLQGGGIPRNSGVGGSGLNKDMIMYAGMAVIIALLIMK